MKYILSTVFIIAVFLFLGVTQVKALDCNLPENREACLAELAKIESEIAGLKTQTNKLESEAASISRDKKLLEIQIQQAKLQIKARELNIGKLVKDISVKEKNITTLQGRIVKSKESLSEIIRASYELDNYTMVEALLAQQEMSAFFQDMDAYASIQSRIKDEI